MTKYGRIGALKAKTGRRQELVDILLEGSEKVKELGTCQQYLVGKDRSNPNLVWISEIWNSKSDHTASLKNEEVRTLIEKALPIIDGKLEEGSEFDIIGGHQ